MDNIQVFENYLPKNKSDKIEEILLSQDFPWFLIKKSSGESKEVNGYKDTVQFEHHFFRDGNQTSSGFTFFCDLLNLSDFISKFNVPNKVIRMKSNLLLKTQKTPNTPHVDFSDPHFVLLYYVNDSDGPTIFYEKNANKFNKIKEIIPKKGTFVLFDGSTYHSSTPPQLNDYRCVININTLTC